MKTVYVLGNRGQLGEAVERACRDAGMHVVGGDIRGDPPVDVTFEHSVRTFLRELEPGDWVVNCAAYTAVDAAEDDEPRAMEVNALAPELIARITQERGAALVHISTDYVYNGQKTAPYTEDDAPDPLNAYGRSKLAGDRGVIRACARHIILRSAWLYGAQDTSEPGGKPGGDFVRTMIRLFAEREEVYVVSDQYGSPTWSRDLGRAVARVLAHPSPAWGIYHCVNEGYASRYEFACAVYACARSSGLQQREVRLIPVPSSAFPTRAIRPLNSRLHTGKFRVQFGFALPHWRDALEAYFRERYGAVSPAEVSRCA